jgi:hypothetical protein
MGVGCGVWGMGNFWLLVLDIYDYLEKEKAVFWQKKNDILPDYVFKKFKDREMYSPHSTSYTQHPVKT